MQVDEQPTSTKEKKPRSEAQQASFKAAVEKLKAKRQQDRDDKVKSKAEKELKKVEAKANELKALAAAPAKAINPLVPRSPPVDPHADVFGRIEKLIDERLSKLAPPAPVIVNMSRKYKRHAEESGSEDEAPAPPAAPKPRTTARGQPMPAAWYDAIFAQRR